MKTSSYLLIAICLCVVPQAFADVPRPNRGPETCTVALVQGADESCRECASSFQGPACEDLFAETPLTFRCRRGGASHWTEVWCAPGGAPLIGTAVPGEEGSGTAAPTNGSAPAPAEGTAAPAAEGTAAAPAAEGTAPAAEDSDAEQAGMTAAPDAPQAADTAPASTRGCSASPVAGETGFGIGALIAALALLRRRRD